jgi:hypothetical protein
VLVESIILIDTIRVNTLSVTGPERMRWLIESPKLAQDAAVESRAHGCKDGPPIHRPSELIPDC